MNIFDYTGKQYKTSVLISDVNSMYVAVVSGDEILMIILNDGKQIIIDACELSGKKRKLNFFDGDYGVHKDDLARWTKRKDSYEWFGVLKGGALDAEV
jgi:hypothetical protein